MIGSSGTAGERGTKVSRCAAPPRRRAEDQQDAKEQRRAWLKIERRTWLLLGVLLGLVLFMGWAER